MSGDGRGGGEPQLPGRIRHNRLLPARPGVADDWPSWVAADVRSAWLEQGVALPWRHQVTAADAAWRGHPVVLSTGTASGKSLGYLLPILAATYSGSTPGDPSAPGRDPVVAPSQSSGRVSGAVSEPVSGAAPGLVAGVVPGAVAGAGRGARGAHGGRGGRGGPPAGGTATAPTLFDESEVVVGPTGDGGPPNVLATGWRQRPHTALYLAPTKALAHDQLRRCSELGLDRWRLAAVDGDTGGDERDWARDYASFVLTNPDLLHYSLLPNHARWRGLLQSLRFVVVDEAHRYRGVFGAQVAAVLRRLRRLAAHYGADPTFVLASATVGDAPSTAAALTGIAGADFTQVQVDSSTRGAVTVDLWEPAGDAEELTTALLTESVAAGRQMIAFVASRRSTELIARRARDQLELRGLSPGSVEAYRGGYLASDRRRIEADLQGGRLRGIAATNALELGVDIAGVDAVAICGYPGTRAALWQQAGRAGRRGNDATVSVIARRQPLDAYVLDHPEMIFEAGAEATVVHPENPYVLGPHLLAAAQELPLTDGDRAFFGPAGIELAEQLAAAGRLRKRAGGIYWTRPERAVDGIDLRSARGEAVDIIDGETGRVLGHVEESAADLVAHPGAVYLHLGETYLCEEWDDADREILVRSARPGYLTQPQQRGDVTILRERARRPLGSGSVHLGDVQVTSQVTSFLRRDLVTGQVWDSTPLDLPERCFRTTAVWWGLPESELPPELAVGSQARLDAGVHAAEHLCVGLLPVFAPCDRWDVGAHSDPSHPQTGAVTVFVHDRHAGGTGFADRAFAVAEAWIRASSDRVRSCDCELGCPACILAPCGSSRGLDRSAATSLLQRLLP